MDKWKVYMEIYQLLEQGFNKSQVARKLGISRPTLYRYLKRDPQEMAKWVDSIKTRKKKLDPYKRLILSWLKEHPDMSAAQIQDWLNERFNEIEVGDSTVRSYVKDLREEYDIPKEKSPRDYEAVQEIPIGEQAQVDFGQTIQKTPEGRKQKLYFIAFVLSHSRYKYKEWLDRPFTTRDVVKAHENAFEWFEGIPHELVYDQDALLVVSENGGDLILTEEFQAYREHRKLHLRVCRKADPESKGQIENVVGYIKNNFAKHRLFHNLDAWNEAGWSWLNRTGNYKIHNTTKKRPVEVFQQEKQHLRPVLQQINISNSSSSITRSVRKDNTILFHSNRYSVPLGTYQKQEKVYISVTDDNHLIIRDSSDGDIIGKHKICHDKGKLIQDRSHTRDRSKGIGAFMETASKHFTDTELALSYLEEVKREYPRYIRDQLQIILKACKGCQHQVLLDQALQACMDMRLFCATDFSDMVQYLQRQCQVYSTNTESANDDQVLHMTGEINESIIQVNTKKRELESYISVLEGSS